MRIREGQGGVDKHACEGFQESYKPLIRKANFFDRWKWGWILSAFEGMPLPALQSRAPGTGRSQACPARKQHCFHRRCSRCSGDHS